MRIITAGYDGTDGTRGASGVGAGGDGRRGQDGTSGQSAKDIMIRVVSGASGCTVSGTHTGAVPYGPTSEIWMDAHGGRGGHGGDGGPGAMGYRGTAGMNASRGSCGTNGGPGGPGGDGGDGGDAGSGGDGGTVRVVMVDDDMDLFMLCNMCNIAHGPKGIGGTGVAAGPGGPGGPGGSSYSWTETHYRTGANGQQESYSTSHSNPGGCSGPPGPPGRPGRDGADGRDGRDGSFRLVIEHDGSRTGTEYTWRYVSHVETLRLKDCTTDDGIFEPGEHCHCWYDLRNVGPMPTPKLQRQYCSFFPTDWLLQPTTSNAVQRFIPTNGVTALDKPIEFDLLYFLEPPPNTVFKVFSHMRWSVQIERVGVFFSEQELGRGHDLPIQFPVKLSPTHGPATITMDEEAPLVVCGHNLSQRATGHGKGRAQRVRVELVTDHDSMAPLNNPDFAQMFTPTNEPIPFHDHIVDEHNPLQNLFENVIVKFGRQARQYSRVAVGVSLFLGDVHEFTRERRIQRMSVELQLSSYYARNEASRMLVVTNHQTSLESYETWKAHSQRLHHQGNFWNASLHDGLTLEQKVPDTPLLTDFARGVIVVENNNPKFLSILRSERNTSKEYVMDTCSAREVTKAVRDSNTGFAVLGRPVNTRTKLLPVDGERVPIPQARGFFEQLKEKTVDEWAAAIRTCPIPEGFGVLDLQKRMTKYVDPRTAWQLVWGSVNVRFGEPSVPIRPHTFSTFAERLTEYFAYYMPSISPESVAQLQALNKADEVLQELTRLIGPELENNNLFQAVDEYALNAAALGGSAAAAITGSKTLQQRARSALCAHANELYDEVARVHPTWKFVVTYELAPYLTHMLSPGTSICGVLLKEIPAGNRMPIEKVRYGRISIVKSAARNGSTIQCLETPDTITGEQIVSLQTTYTILKALPMAEKLKYLQKPGFIESHPDNALALEAAIVSDIAEEQSALRRFEWSGRILDSTVLEHLPVLGSFVLAVFEEISETCNQVTDSVRSVVLKVAMFLHYLLCRWVRWYDYLTIHRRWRTLTSIGTDLLEKVVRAYDRSNQANAIRMKLKEQYDNMSLEGLITCAAGGCSGRRSASNDELLFRVMEYERLLSLRQREKPPHVVLNKWVMNNNRSRKLVLHKLRADFGPAGEVSRRTDRESQHSRMDFLTCPGKHAAEELVVATKVPCGVCFENLDTCYGEIPGVGGYSCRSCNWYVCNRCWSEGNDARWNPQTDEPSEQV